MRFGGAITWVAVDPHDECLGRKSKQLLAEEVAGKFFQRKQLEM